MIYVVVFTCVVALTYGLSQQMQAKLTGQVYKAVDSCKTEVPITPEDLALLMTKVIPPSTEAKCFVACVHKYFGMQDSDGKINAAAAKAALEELKSDDPELHGKWLQVLEKCAVPENQAANECDTAENILSCGIKASTELGIETNLR